MQKNNTKAVLLVGDMQDVILSNYPVPAAFYLNVANAIATARKKEIPVIYTIVGFRPGAPDISAHNKAFAANNKQRWLSLKPDDWQKIHDDVTPLPNEIIVTKKRVSAFAGSDLEVVLRSLEAQHIIFTGIATSGVILSTVREAADKDYQLTVLEDACIDGDEEVHRVLMTKVFPRQAEVTSTDEWISKFS